MDLYTSRFGKLQKQKEEAIAQIVRERQKIIDTNNEMIRKGMIKSASSSNMSAAIASQVNQFFATTDSFTGIERNKGASQNLTYEVRKSSRVVKNLETGEQQQLDWDQLLGFLDKVFEEQLEQESMHA